MAGPWPGKVKKNSKNKNSWSWQITYFIFPFGNSECKSLLYLNIENSALGKHISHSMLLFSRCTTNSSYIWCGLVLRFRITDPRDLFTSDSSIFAFFTYQAPLDGRKMSSLSPYYLLLRVTYKIKAWGRCIRPTTVPSSAQIAHSYLFFVPIYFLKRL